MGYKGMEIRVHGRHTQPRGRPSCRVDDEGEGEHNEERENFEIHFL